LKIIMSPLFLIPLFYLAAVLQAWLGAHWVGVGPDFVALVAICWLTTSTGRRGGVIMAMAGFVLDLNASGPLGMATAVFFVVGQALVWLRSRMKLDGFLGNCCQAWIAATAIPLAMAILARSLGTTSLGWRSLIQNGMLAGLANFTLAVLWLWLLNFTGNRRASSALLIGE
jgi:rod shape-determining protein MreD